MILDLTEEELGALRLLFGIGGDAVALGEVFQSEVDAALRVPHEVRLSLTRKLAPDLAAFDREISDIARRESAGSA